MDSTKKTKRRCHHALTTSTADEATHLVLEGRGKGGGGSTLLSGGEGGGASNKGGEGGKTEHFYYYLRLKSKRRKIGSCAIVPCMRHRHAGMNTHNTTHSSLDRFKLRHATNWYVSKNEGLIRPKIK